MKKTITLSIVLFFIFGISIFLTNTINTAISTVNAVNAANTSTSIAKPSDYGLKEGDLISAIFSDDPDVYIINNSGYKRLFLNPAIFNFYSHLGGFFNVKLVSTEVRDAFATSGLFRNCEINDPKVYGVDIDGEDTGKLHWVNVSGETASSEDPEFFKKVFCINNSEFKWYAKGSEFKAVKDVPKYERMKEKATTSTQEKIAEKAEIKNIGQSTICHYPPGNAAAYQTITVNASALKAHLDHGDVIGVCPSVIPAPSITPAPTTTPTPSVSPVPSPSVSPNPSITPALSPSTSPSPSGSPAPTPSPSATPIPTPTISVSAPISVTIGWYKGFSGQPPVGTYQMAISFLYASNVSDVQSFRLYLKKPGESSFSAVATFVNPSSISSTCSNYVNSGEWKMRNCTSSGGGYWQIFSPLGLASSYAVGEYNAYITAVNNSGVEGPVSSTAKNIVSKTTILSPIGVQNSLTPQFRWTIPNSWPGGLFNPQVYDGTNYVWGYGGFSIAAGTVEGSYTYNGPPLTSSYFGPALSPSKTYYVNIWAEGSDSSGTRNFSMGDSNPSFTVSSAPTPTPISCAPITVSISPTTPSSQNVNSGQGGVPIVIFNIAANCNLSLNSFAVSLLPMPNGYQNISYLRLYDNATGVQLGSTITASIAGLNFTGLSQPILANQTLSLKVVGDISPSAVVGSTVYGVFGGSSATDTAGTFVGNNASGNLIAGNTMTIVALFTKSNQSNNLAAFSRNLTIGSVGNDVKQLQALLVKEVNYSAGLITGYFGSITREAVKRLQTKYSVSPVSGFFGEITRKTLNATILNW